MYPISIFKYLQYNYPVNELSNVEYDKTEQHNIVTGDSDASDHYI